MANPTNVAASAAAGPDTDGPDDSSVELETALKKKGWWEKTVEYWFVRHVMPRVSDAFPMAGEPEASFGDLLLREGNKFRLIEFKATRACFGLEKKKYPKLYSRKNGNTPEYFAPGKFEDLLLEKYKSIATYSRKAAHVFVYGDANAQGGFELLSRIYADRKAPHLALAGESDVEALASMSGTEMLIYMAMLERERRGRAGTGSFVFVGLAGGESLLLTTQEFMGGYQLGLDANPKAKAAVAAQAESQALADTMAKWIDETTNGGLSRQPLPHPRRLGSKSKR